MEFRKEKICITHLPRYIPPEKATHLLRYEAYPNIINYVAIVSLGSPIELKRVAMYISNCEHKPSFAAITIRIDSTTCLLFTTGIMVITAGKTFQTAKADGHLYRLLIETVPQVVIKQDPTTGIKRIVIETLAKYTQFQNFTAVNVVGAEQLTTASIALGKLDRSNDANTGWNPDIFPGLYFVLENAPDCPLITVDECKALIFDTGKAVIMGAGCREDVYAASKFLRNTVQKYSGDNAPLLPQNRFRHRIESMMQDVKNVRKYVPRSTKNSVQPNKPHATSPKIRKRKKPTSGHNSSAKVALNDNSNNNSNIIGGDIYMQDTDDTDTAYKKTNFSPKRRRIDQRDQNRFTDSDVCQDHPLSSSPPSSPLNRLVPEITALLKVATRKKPNINANDDTGAPDDFLTEIYETLLHNANFENSGLENPKHQVLGKTSRESKSDNIITNHASSRSNNDRIVIDKNESAEWLGTNDGGAFQTKSVDELRENYEKELDNLFIF